MGDAHRREAPDRTCHRAGVHQAGGLPVVRALRGNPRHAGADEFAGVESVSRVRENRGESPPLPGNEPVEPAEPSGSVGIVEPTTAAGRAATLERHGRHSESRPPRPAPRGVAGPRPRGRRIRPRGPHRRAAGACRCRRHRAAGGTRVRIPPRRRASRHDTALVVHDRAGCGWVPDGTPSPPETPRPIPTSSCCSMRRARIPPNTS